MEGPRKNITKIELDKPLNVYSAHFEYKDLFQRLEIIQKQRNIKRDNKLLFTTFFSQNNSKRKASKAKRIKHRKKSLNFSDNLAASVYLGYPEESKRINANYIKKNNKVSSTKTIFGNLHYSTFINDSKVFQIRKRKNSSFDHSWKP